MDVVTPIAVAPVRVWQILVDETDRWWSEPYLGPSSGSMQFDPVLGGTVRASDGKGRATLHGTVRAFDPPERLEIGGVLVPGAYAGTITFTIEKTSLGAELRVEQMARGRLEASTEDRMHNGWTTLTARIADLAES